MDSLPDPMRAPRDFLDALCRTAIRAAGPNFCRVPLPPPPKGRMIVVGAGKSAASMAAAFECRWPGPIEGLVITRYGHACPTRTIEVIEASHPLPDENGVTASARILDLVAGANPCDLVVALISGGASSLLCLPAQGIDLATKRAIGDRLLKSGADITDINAVRCNLSAVKNGRLAAASAAPVVTYVISDVAGDDPKVIGSGPTVGGGVSPEYSLALLDKYGVIIPGAVHDAIVSNRPPGTLAENVALLASGRTVLDTATACATAAGLEVLDLGDAVIGEAREVGRAMSGVARAIASGAHPLKPPALIISGGETSVTVRGGGRGGRNGEFLLAFCDSIAGQPGIYAAAIDTDGIDGMEDNAGAIVDPNTLSRNSRVTAADALTRNDAYGFFDGTGDLFFTGPTLTNVNDFRAILATPADRGTP